MRLIDYILFALKRIRGRLFESVLIILAVGLGTGIICSALAMTFTFMDQMSTVQQDDFFRTINIRSGEDYMFTGNIRQMGEKLPEPAQLTVGLIYDIRENASAVDYTFIESTTSLRISEQKIPMFHDDGPMTQEKFEEQQRRIEAAFLQTTAATPDYFSFNKLELRAGNFFTDQDVREGNRVIVLGFETAERLFGDNPMGKEVEVIDQDPYTVIGVIEKLDEESMDGRRSWFASQVNNRAFIPYTASGGGRELLDREVNGITAAVGDDGNLEEAVNQINSYLGVRFAEGFVVSSHLTQLQDIQPQIRQGQIAAVFTASLGLIIAAINILNLMMARVLKRTRDIGVLTAVGADQRSIFYSFLVESLVMGFLGAVVGFGLSKAGVWVLTDMVEYLTITVDYRVFIAAVVVSIGTSLLFGIYPAMEAAKIDPVDALRTE